MRNQVISDGALSLINTLLLAGFNLVISAIVARHLEPVAMGEYSFLIWLLTTVALLLSLGLPNTILRFGAEVTSKHSYQVAVLLFKRVCFLTILLGLVWSGLYLFLLQFPQVMSAIPLLARHPLLLITGFFVMLLHGVTTSFAKSQRNFKWIIIANFIGLGSIVLLSLRAKQNTSESYIFAYIAGFSIVVAILCVYYRDAFWPKANRDELPEDLWPRLRNYSVSLILLLIIDIVVWQRSEIFFLQWFNKVEDVAYYNIAYDLSAKSMRLISASVPAVLLPIFAGMYGAADFARIRHGYVEVTRYLCLAAFPLAAFIAGIATPLVSLIYGDNYLAVVPILRILIVTSSLGVVAGAGSSVIHALERQHLMIIAGFLIAIVNLAGDLLLIPRQGAMGGAIVNAVSQILGVLWGTVYLVYYVKMPFPYRSILHVIISSCVLYGVTHLITLVSASWISVVIAGLVSVTVFILVMWYLDHRRNEFALLKSTTTKWFHLVVLRAAKS